MMTLPDLPPAVHRYILGVFRAANLRLSEKIASVPNTSEPSLDMTLIEYLTHHAAPRVVAPGWAVRLDVHYLGGLRHFRSWEIADIGLLVFAKQRGSIVAQKVALLQSKRLYPVSGAINEETRDDYMIGFGTLLPGSPNTPSLALNHRYEFTEQCRYKALRVGDEQYEAIKEYETDKGLPVHYLFYNPWVLPTTYTLPSTGKVRLGAAGNGGCRVLPSHLLRSAMASRPAASQPSFADLSGLVTKGVAHRHGWRLEHFVSNLVMKCKEGKVYDSPTEDSMYALFNRRSGPIAAALAITVEQFEQ